MDATCVWPACDRATYARGLCARDWMRAKRVGRLHEFSSPPRTCLFCGETFETGSRGQNAYCTQRCRLDALEAARRADRAAAVAGRQCDRCQEPVPESARRDARHCSPVCQQAQWYDENDERLRRAAITWKSNNRARATEYDHRRRAVKNGQDAERIDLAAVWERDAGECWLCERPVDPSAKYPDRMRASLDHVVPIVKGGGHTMRNVALAHLRCNISKKDKILDRVPRALAKETVPA